MCLLWLVHRIAHTARIVGKHVRVIKVLDKVRVKNSSTPSQVQKTCMDVGRTCMCVSHTIVCMWTVLFDDVKLGDVLCNSHPG